MNVDLQVTFLFCNQNLCPVCAFTFCSYVMCVFLHDNKKKHGTLCEVVL